MEERVRKNAVKSHRERVDEMNKFLDSLSDVSPVLIIDWPLAPWHAKGRTWLVDLRVSDYVNMLLHGAWLNSSSYEICHSRTRKYKDIERVSKANVLILSSMVYAWGEP